ncbi:MAG: Uma2 family endonuclease [Cyanobacteria bacterium]|nr:Uma2 family endonuclease [Cyanobacteriota bacterium]MDA0867444.1 Uma2 family endonuclease [Cyanobacteriota bacterium]
MAIAPSPPKTYTAAEYLALEVESDVRSEYRQGEIVAMTGGTPAHNEIIGNLIFLMKAALRGQPYSVFVTDQRLWVPESDIYTYPDAMVVPRPVELQTGRKDTVMNPVLIAEVLSDSTEGYDRGDKFAAYRTLPTFQEYVLIDQSRPHVERFVRQGENQWLLTEYSGLEAKVALSSVAVEITLADLYDAIAFE